MVATHQENHTITRMVGRKVGKNLWFARRRKSRSESIVVWDMDDGFLHIEEFEMEGEQLGRRSDCHWYTKEELKNIKLIDFVRDDELES